MKKEKEPKEIEEGYGGELLIGMCVCVCVCVCECVAKGGLG